MIVRRGKGYGVSVYDSGLKRKRWVGTFVTLGEAREAERAASRRRGVGRLTCGEFSELWLTNYARAAGFSHYGRLGQPLVVAVLAMSMSVDRESVEEVLFGREALQYSVDDPDDNRWIRQRNGVWMRGGGPVSRPVSAVALSSRLRPWTCAHELPDLWLNPWSDEPLHCDLPFAVGMTNDDGQTTYGEARADATAILGLSADWPGPEPPFA